MTTIIVEDGSIVTGANSYVTAAELTTYAADRGITITGNTTELLLKAMDYIESLNFIGIKTYRNQALQWPRAYVYLDGYYVNSIQIPKELKNGQLTTALAIDEGNGPLKDVTTPVKRLKADVVEIEYMAGSSTNTIVRTINAALWKLLGSAASANVIKVSKA